MDVKNCKDCVHSEQDWDMGSTWTRHCWRGRVNHGPAEWVRSKHGPCGPEAKFFELRPTHG